MNCNLTSNLLALLCISWSYGKWINNTETATEIDMKEGIGAAYASVNAQFNTSTSLVVEARYEYSYTNMDDPKSEQSLVDPEVGRAFPKHIVFKKAE